MSTPRYRNLIEAVRDLDEIIIRTISGFSVEAAEEGYLAVFKVAFFGPDLEALENVAAGERAATIANYPDVSVIVDDAVWPQDQIDELQATGILGELYARQISPYVRGNDTDMSKWLVTTHCGSQAERITWLKSIR
ncbi:MAG: hypothetical protein O2968_21970 [Acidobacteria bacterium]|nr:hypothetical protein [Acidobacteriota bacterium]